MAIRDTKFDPINKVTPYDPNTNYLEPITILKNSILDPNPIMQNFEKLQIINDQLDNKITALEDLYTEEKRRYDMLKASYSIHDHSPDEYDGLTGDYLVDGGQLDINYLDGINPNGATAGVISKNMYGLLPDWVASKSYSVNDFVKIPGYTDLFLKCITAGTSGATFTVTDPHINDIYDDNTVKWEVYRLISSVYINESSGSYSTKNDVSNFSTTINFSKPFDKTMPFYTTAYLSRFEDSDKGSIYYIKLTGISKAIDNNDITGVTVNFSNYTRSGIFKTANHTITWKIVSISWGTIKNE